MSDEAANLGRAIVLGAGIREAAMAVLMAQPDFGARVIVLEPDRHLARLDALDRLDTLGSVLGAPRPVRRLPNRRYVTPIAPTTFIHTPKPISKRKARRLRGKASA